MQRKEREVAGDIPPRLMRLVVLTFSVALTALALAGYCVAGEGATGAAVGGAIAAGGTTVAAVLRS